MGIFKAIRTWFSGKESAGGSSSVTVSSVDASPVTEMPAVVHESPVSFSPPTVESFPTVSDPVSQGTSVVETVGVVEAKTDVAHTSPRRRRKSVVRTSKRRSK